jgi:hypothetical protein
MDGLDHRPYAILPCDRGTSKYRVKRYRERAEELRTIADDLIQQECHDMMMRLANTYDDLARREEAPRN